METRRLPSSWFLAIGLFVAKQTRTLEETCIGGAIGFFGFPVLVIFEIGFSVFDLKIFRFSVLVPTGVFDFSGIRYPVFGFY